METDKYFKTGGGDRESWKLEDDYWTPSSLYHSSFWTVCNVKNLQIVQKQQEIWDIHNIVSNIRFLGIFLLPIPSEPKVIEEFKYSYTGIKISSKIEIKLN